MAKIYGLATVMAVTVLLVAGCMPSYYVYDDIYKSRARSYDEWVKELNSEESTKPKLEGKLFLLDALKIALVHNKQLQSIVQEKSRAEGQIVESLSGILPSVTLSSSYTRLDSVSSFEVDGGSVSIGSVNNYSVDLRVSQPLYTGGASSSAIRAAELFSVFADEQVRGVTQNVIFEVERGYLDVLLFNELYKISQDAVTSAQTQLDDVKKKREQGVASDFDVLRAQVELSNFQAQLIQQRNQINLAKAALLKSMGVSQQSDIILADKLVYEPREYELTSVVQTAFENRPELYQAELQVRLQQEALNVAKSDYYPKLYGFFDQQWAKPDPKSSTNIAWGDAWTAGITLELAIFDGLRREGRIIQEKALLEEQKINLSDTEERVLLEIHQSLLSLQDAKEFVGSQKLNLERAAEGLRLAEVGYREGINTEVEVTDARAALTRASANYYQAIHDYMVAKLSLEKAIGILGPTVKEPRVEPETTVEVDMQNTQDTQNNAPEHNGGQENNAAATEDAAEDTMMNNE